MAHDTRSSGAYISSSLADGHLGRDIKAPDVLQAILGRSGPLL